MRTDSQIKVFAMNDCDYMAAESVESATALYMEKYAGGISAKEALDDVHELTAADLDRFRFRDEEDDGQGTSCSFREHLEKLEAAGEEFPCFFASSEC